MRNNRSDRGDNMDGDVSGVMKESGEAYGVVYVGRPEDALWREVELIEGEALQGCGSKARRGLLRNVGGMVLLMSLR